jgi:hypothetical protein
MTPSNVLRKLFIDPKSLGRWCLLGCALVGAQVSAQGTNAAGWSYYPMPDGRTVVYSSGAPVGSIPAVPSPPAGSLVVSGGKAISTDGGAAINVAGKVPMTLTKGAPVVIDVASKVPMAKAAAMLVKGLKMLPLLANGFALYELAKELGFNPIKEADGSLTIKKQGDLVSAQCDIAQHQICQQYASVNLYGPGLTCSYEISGGMCRQIMHFANGGSDIADAWWPNTSAPVVDVASTEQEFVDAIAQKSGWPTSSAVSAALRDAAQLTGDTVPIEGPHTVTGPATSPGPSTTVQNSDGTKSVTTTVNNHSYAGDTINTSTVTTTNNYNTSNQITSSTTVTAEPAPEKPSDCDKYPDSNACRKDEFDVPTDQVPKTTKTITWAAENLGFGSGQCIPPVTLTNRLGTQTISFQPYCDAITTWVKPLVLAFSLLAAFFIVAPIKQEGV